MSRQMLLSLPSEIRNRQGMSCALPEVVIILSVVAGETI